MLLRLFLCATVSIIFTVDWYSIHTIFATTGLLRCYKKILAALLCPYLIRFFVAAVNAFRILPLLWIDVALFYAAQNITFTLLWYTCKLFLPYTAGSAITSTHFMYPTFYSNEQNVRLFLKVRQSVAHLGSDEAHNVSIDAASAQPTASANNQKLNRSHTNAIFSMAGQNLF